MGADHGRVGFGLSKSGDRDKFGLASASIWRMSDKKTPVVGKASTSKETVAPIAAPPRDGSKQALVISMLLKKGGATIGALVDATGWLPHTTRAALTGLRRRGFKIERSRDDGASSVYRISSYCPNLRSQL